MGHLIYANRNGMRFVHDDVRRLQDRIPKESEG